MICSGILEKTTKKSLANLNFSRLFPKTHPDDNQINAKGDFNGSSMSKIEPIDEDQDYHDGETGSDAAANYKDDDGSIENGNIDDADKEAIDSKPILGSLNNISATVDGDNENANVTVEKKRRDSENANNAIANDTNLNESEANDRGDIDSKLGKTHTFMHIYKKYVFLINVWA